MTHLIGVDWGTSSFRATLMDADGTALAETSADAGITRIPNGEFRAILDAQISGWRTEHPEARIILSGMIGSRNGWVEAPYVRAPAGAEELAAAVSEIPDGARAAILLVPGIDLDREGQAPDVMRGEETQIIGSSAVLADAATVVAPGSHTKWVRVEGGRIVSFTTYMSGEVFHALTHHTILSAFATQSEPRDDAAFQAGVKRFADVESERDLMAEIFTARTLPLMGRMLPAAVSDFLSGLVIGSEIRHALKSAASGSIHLIGRGDLVERYKSALAVFNRDAQSEPSGAAARGQYAISKMAGLI